MGGRRALALAAKLLASGAVLWLLFSRIGAEDVFARLSIHEPAMAALAALLLVAQIFFGMLRWRAICGALRTYVPTPREALGWIGMGVALGQVLPSSVGGDAYRIVALARRGGIGAATRTVVAERVIGLATLSALALALSLAAAHLAGASLAFGMYAALAGAVVVGVVLAGAVARLLARWTASRLISLIAEDVRAMWARSALVPTVSLSVLIHASSLAAMVCLTAALSLDDVRWWQVLLVGPGVLLAAAIPLSLGGWGLREAGMVFGLAAFSVPEASALALSISYGLTLVVSGVGGLGLWLVFGRGGGR